MYCIVGISSVRLPVLDAMQTHGFGVSGTNLRSRDWRSVSKCFLSSKTTSCSGYSLFEIIDPIMK